MNSPDPVRVLHDDPWARLARAAGRAGAASSDFDLNPHVNLPADRVLRPAAVLVAVTEGRHGLELVLTKRASHLRHHPGQVAFPGGKIEAEDAGPEAAALREAHEEIGLDPSIVEPFGRLPVHETVTGFAVQPVLARIHAPFAARAQLGEVDEVFSVPLSHVTDPARFRVERRLWRGEWRRYYTVPYGPYYIWGATARILRGLAHGLGRDNDAESLR
ncbi:CoA pyrophosphatase [Plastorhodobacter daqingensis]|uniref:CoA pyrophosphatase n=1 Tax=Plastorhodobacter daqingensis TaxID=1387281 RepID=A0ABW2UH79_9RHOB